MKLKKISKPDIKELLKRSVGEWETYVPLENKDGGDVLFSLLPGKEEGLDEALSRVNLNDEWVVISPKDIFFPQMEVLFSFDREGIKDRAGVSRKLIFGARPCDTRGIAFVDEFFKRNFEDAYYLSRAEDRLVVTIGCLKPPRPEACFCTSAGTGPFIKQGYDLQLVDTGEEYLVEVGSDRGREFMNSHPDLFKDAGESASDKLEAVKSEAMKALTVKVDFEKALEIMKSNKDFEENYKRVGERCLYCGACLYACPTCTCFNIFDDRKGDAGVRKRSWDACVFEGYTREASGHNPREEKWLRTSRRYEHKLRYDCQVAGTSGCVGCGRCLSSCPVNIGISKFVEEITTNKRNM